MSAAAGPDPARAALDAAVLAFVREASREPEWKEQRDDPRFEALALEAFAFQFAHCAPYRRFCEGRGATPSRVRISAEIPAVPTGAFKELPLRCFPAEREVRVFRTSGTAGARRGELHLDSLALYEASLLPTLRRHLFPDLAPGARARMRVLAPAPGEVPDSSLSHMLGAAVDALGAPGSGFDVTAGSLDVEGLLGALRRSETSGEPLALLGTAFAFVHLLDALGERGERLRLPPGSRAMETGGFKGRSRELAPAALYRLLDEQLGLPEARVVNQYGMTELGSQFYDSVLLRPDEPRRKLGPPWARVLVVDPESGEEAPPGAVGSIRVLDLANTGSAIAVQTADLGRARGDAFGGFEVLGREVGAEARGCSLAADTLLAAP